MTDDTANHKSGKRAPVLAAILVGSLTVAAYLSLVVIATPTIPAGVALRLAVSTNWPYMSLIAGASGLQTYLFVYSRNLPCRVGRQKGAAAGGSFLTSFASFFGLTNVGCCGLFPFWVSLAFGGGEIGFAVSSFFVNNSTVLAFVGLVSVWASIALTVRNIWNSKKIYPTGIRHPEVFSQPTK